MLTRAAYWLLHKAWFEAVKCKRPFTPIRIVAGTLYRIEQGTYRRVHAK